MQPHPIVPRTLLLGILLALAAAPGAEPASGQSFRSLRGGPHDFSSGDEWGTVEAGAPRGACAVCHVPARRPGEGEPESPEYGVYGAAGQMADAAGAPGRASRMCLSCHDGVTGPGHFEGPDVGVGHPIAVDYDEVQNHDLRTGIQVESDGLPLYPGAGTPRVECSSCHDPHDNAYGNFLRMPNTGSRLCLTCHQV